MILRYDLNLERHEQLMLSMLILLIFLIYFSIIAKSEATASLFMLMITPSFVR